jgi:hypothetical protein
MNAQKKISFFKRITNWWDEYDKPLPIEQRQIDLGRLTAEVVIIDGGIYKFEFVGEYDKSKYYFDTWFDYYTTARKDFTKWRQSIKDHGFVTLSPQNYVPVNRIKEINVISESEYIVTTTRAWKNNA